MLSRFEQCLNIVLEEEGGYSDDPNDNGGATNLGIEFGEWNAWKAEHGQEASSLSDFARDLTPADVAPLYHAKYWEAAGCDPLPAPLDMVIFDVSVLEGIGRSCIYLNATQGTHDAKARALAIQQLRLAHFNGIVINNPSQKEFLAGWCDRVKRLNQRIESGAI